MTPMENDMFEVLLAHPVIPVVEIDDAKDATGLAEALLAGGISVIEITMRTSAAAAAIERIARNVPDILVGAGTVLTEEESLSARDAGARFGVAPGTNPTVIASFSAAGLPFLPGAITPTEIESAMSSGCRLLKFFPAGAAGGPAMIKALHGPFSHHGIRFCATGGVGEANMAEYLALDAVWAVGGSWLAPRAMIADHAWDDITERARAACFNVRQM